MPVKVGDKVSGQSSRDRRLQARKQAVPSARHHATSPQPLRAAATVRALPHTQLPSAVLKHKDGEGINDVSTESLCAGKKVRGLRRGCQVSHSTATPPPPRGTHSRPGPLRSWCRGRL
jgi:hypothetical protein